MKIIIFLIVILNNSYSSDLITYSTSAYNSFTGWDFYSNNKISIGIINDPDYPIYQHKIHDSKGDFFDKSEYFCDPDDIIEVETKDNVYRKYISYLNMKKDIYFSNDRSFFRVSYLFKETNVKNKFDLRIDKTLLPDKNYVKTNIYFDNLNKEKVNYSFIVQDAAYLNLEDNSQKNVVPYSFIEDKENNEFFFRKLI